MVSKEGNSVKVAVCISQWSVRKEAVLKLRCIYLKSQYEKEAVLKMQCVYLSGQ